MGSVDLARQFGVVEKAVAAAMEPVASFIEHDGNRAITDVGYAVRERMLTPVMEALDETNRLQSSMGGAVKGWRQGSSGMRTGHERMVQRSLDDLDAAITHMKTGLTFAGSAIDETLSTTGWTTANVLANIEGSQRDATIVGNALEFLLHA